MSADHYILLEADDGSVNFEFVCEAPATAPCRNVPDCECSEWHDEECRARFPDGPPTKAIDYCNDKEFIDAEGAEWLARSGSVRVPVTTDWGDSTYVWDFDEVDQ